LSGYGIGRTLQRILKEIAEGRAQIAAVKPRDTDNWQTPGIIRIPRRVEAGSLELMRVPLDKSEGSVKPAATPLGWLREPETL
jgi:hypothetical protein